MGKGFNIYFGDVHNHGDVGYARGTLERMYKIAKNHLDFFAFTPHAYWPDIGHYENNCENKWINGFAVTKTRWPEVIQMAQKYDKPGEFAVLCGYEWHSTNLGDYHILFPDLKAELILFNDLRKMQRFAKQRGCLLIPHHPSYAQGHRGANFIFRDPGVSPIMEIYSEHGNAEHDRAPFPYIRHTEGGRWTRNTFQYFLKQGHRVGVIAGTDDHLGYPGAYREGLAAVLAKNLTRKEVFHALKNRRCYGVTGDRIRLEFGINNAIMGQELPYVNDRNITANVAGWDQVDRIEVLKNNHVIFRDFPMDKRTSTVSWKRPVLVRFEYGWGPWPGLNMGRTCNWDVEFRLRNGVLLEVQPCFQSGPFDEERYDAIKKKTDKGIHLESHTALKEQFEDISTKGIVMKILGTPETKLKVILRSPLSISLSIPLKKLAQSSCCLYTGDFPRESAMIHRLVFAENCLSSFAIQDSDDGRVANWYYVRVIQANGQLAWSSPIWIEAKI